MITEKTNAQYNIGYRQENIIRKLHVKDFTFQSSGTKYKIGSRESTIIKKKTVV